MPEAPFKRRLLQFQLRTILVLITILGLGVAQFATMRRASRVEEVNRDLSAENAKLRVEAGYLEIDDPTQVSVLRMRNFDEMTWQWKIWLPKGDWYLNVEIHDIPAQRALENGASVGPVSGEREVVGYTTIRKDANGVWKLRTRLDQSQIGCDLELTHDLVKPRDGLINRAPYSEQVAGHKGQESLDPQKSVVLLRLRASEPVTTPSGGIQWRDPVKDEVDGVMVWLRRAK